MRARRLAVVEVEQAIAAAIGSVASWLEAQMPIDVAPIAEGQPATTSVVYYAPMMVVAFLLVTLAGVLAVVGVGRWRRS